VLSGHNDQRVVRSMAVLSSITGGEIDGAEASRKSYPDFFDVIEKLGIEVTYCDD
jgi:3-phosphoshikimate 1-carboxyvinyltransferase